jgi:AAA domain
MVLCHRGTLDALVYWLRNGWEEAECFSFTEMTREAHLARYYGVIHLETAAIGAERHYQRWPVAHRPESVEEAATVDAYCKRSWDGHERRVVIDNTNRDWQERADVACSTLRSWFSSFLSAS